MTDPRPATEQRGPARPVEAAARPPHTAAGEEESLADRDVPLSTLIRVKLVRGMLAACLKCLGLRGLYRLGRFFARLEFLCDYRRRGRVDRKLVSYFKDQYTPRERRHIALRYFQRIRCDKMLYTIMDRVPREQILANVREINLDRVDQALAGGKGVYIALCHFGSHHVAGLIMGLKGYDIVGVRDPRQSAVRTYIQRKYRETFPELARLKVFAATGFPRAIYRHMQANRIVASLIDADRKRGETTRTHPVTIFGEQRNYLAGPLQIAIRCGAPILQGFVVSRENFQYDLIVVEPLHTGGPCEDEERVVGEVIQRYATAVEQFAREHPDHLMNI